METYIHSTALHNKSVLHIKCVVSHIKCRTASVGISLDQYVVAGYLSDELQQLRYGARSAMNEDAGMLRQFQPLEAVRYEARLIVSQKNPT